MEMARWNMIVFLFKLVFFNKINRAYNLSRGKKERERRGKEEGTKEKMEKGRKKNKSLRLSSSKLAS